MIAGDRLKYGALALCLLSLPVSAAEPVLTEAWMGRICWTNTDTQGVFSVEWAPSVAGAWTGSWTSLRQQTITGAIMSAEVPMFFRVRVTPTPVGTEWVTVSNLQNAADSTGYGAVNYEFHMARYEVNNGQYATFLNTVDRYGSNNLALYNTNMATDARGGITLVTNNPAGTRYVAKTNMFDKPVNYVSFWDACRYANWMHNEQGVGSTEDGAYTLNAVKPANTSVSRNPGALCFVPSENEWYKAAYYKGSSGYWSYPTRADSAPVLGISDSTGSITNDTTSIANYSFGAQWNGQTGNVTAVGSGGVGSQSTYGAADMAGNVHEWDEGIPVTGTRCIRGGCWYSISSYLLSSCRNGFDPTTEYPSVGFRIAKP
jgi:formylglycine-generating enzyme